MSKDPVIRSKPATFRSVILGAGILANKLVTLHIKMALPEIQSATILKGVVKVCMLNNSSYNYTCMCMPLKCNIIKS